ncbi:MAG: hypothetical protein CM15mP22_5250 [Gammaproteobacteria bacterium]|nr:MAG: hypothetical protein CM15mP22_5250 [Gammaproteobacteria bacterium]
MDKDAIFMKFDMRLKPGSEKDYAAAWTKYVETNASLNTGSAGFLFLSCWYKDSTHIWVLSRASNMPQFGFATFKRFNPGESHKGKLLA